LYDEDDLMDCLEQIEEEKGGINVTMIAEKPKIARKIAEVVSRYNFNTIKEGKMIKYEFEGEFKGIKAAFRVLSVFGHIYK
jgi:DNA topoisomerase III